MLTSKQRELLMFIHRTIRETGLSPSFDEMRDALDLASKSGVHRLIMALEERGFLRRLPNRARALEVLKLPESAAASAPPGGRTPFKPSVVAKQERSMVATVAAQRVKDVPIVGRISAGLGIEAIQQDHGKVALDDMLGTGDHFALMVEGDSMINAGILNGDIAILERATEANNGDIVVALIDDVEATLKRFRRRGGSIALDSANPAYETRIFGPDRIKVQGRLVSLLRRYS
jgi:SOS-response transcriptional repressor, LexA